LYTHHSRDIKDLKATLHSILSAFEVFNRINLDYSGTDSKIRINTEYTLSCRDALNCCLELYKQTGDHKYLEDSWEILEQNKKLELYNSIDEVQFKSAIGISDSLIELEHQLTKSINTQKSKIITLTEDSQNNTALANRDSLNKELLELQYQRKELIADFEHSYPQYYYSIFWQKVGHFESNQKLLNKNEALLEYAILDSVLLIYAITNNRIGIYSVAIDSQFIKNLKTFEHYLSYQPVKVIIFDFCVFIDLVS